MKVCRGCNELKSLDEFHLNAESRDGHARRCKACRKRFAQENRDKIAIQQKTWREANKDNPDQIAKKHVYYMANRERALAYSQAHKERIYAKKKIRYHKTKEITNAKRRNDPLAPERRRQRRRENVECHRKKDREYMARRRSTDMGFRLLCSLRARMSNALDSKSERTHTLLGCTPAWFIRHLESKFDTKMSWGNYGSYWHIDHIRPCASFDLTDPKQQKACFHWSNCQPLEAIENKRKNDRYIEPKQDGEKGLDLGVSPVSHTIT